jgi:hypothetical protein
MATQNRHRRHAMVRAASNLAHHPRFTDGANSVPAGAL